MHFDDNPDYFKVSLELANKLAESEFKAAQFKVLAETFKAQRDELSNAANNAPYESTPES